MKFLEDKEIDLEQHDLLNTKQYANSLIETIKHAPRRYTIGLFGEWGSGKSSIIKTAQIKLESEKENKVKFITYDAWKYANDSFRRTFLLEMAKSLGVSKDKQKSLFNDFYTNQNKDIKIEKQKNYKFMFFFLSMFVVIFIASLFFNLDTNNILTIQAFLGLLILSIHFYKNSTDDLKFSMTEPLFFAPEQFEECFNEMTDKALNRSSDDKWFLPFMSQGNKYDRLVIVIDNIDRCDKKLSYELLTNIKNFLGDKDDVIFIIPLDNGALKRHLKVNDSSEKEADEFLRKFFNVTLTIKPFKALDLYDFTNDLNIKEELKLNPDSISIISEEYASNPRRIIQLLNNLSTEFEILKSRLDDEFILEYQSLIVVLMILREEWNSFYKKVFLQPHMLVRLNLEEFKDDIALKSFLHRTKAITTSVNADLIERILYNKDNHQNISSEVLESLNNGKLDVVIEYLKDKSNYTNLMKYLIDKLKLEISRDTYRTSALQVFKHILKVNTLNQIEKYHNIQIEGIFSNSEQWLLVIDNLGKDDVDDFFNYVNATANQNLLQLRDISLERFKYFWSKDSEITEDNPEIWTTYLEVFINYTESTDVLKKLKGMFQRFYVHHFINGDYLYETNWLKENKLKYVVGEGLIDVLIEKLDFNLNENNYYSELLYLAEHNILSLNHVQKIIKQLMGQTVEVSSEELLTHINALSQLFKNIPTQNENIQEIVTYINSLINNRAGINIQNQRTTINLLNELNNDKKKIEILLSFYLEIYRMTGNKTNIVPLCTTLLNKYPTHITIFYRMLIDLRDKNEYTLKPFFDYLLNETNITDEILNLYTKIFIHPDVNIDKVKEKISIYIKLIIDGKEADKIIDFMNNIIDNSKIKEIVSTEVHKLELENIKKLPLKIQSLAYDTFNEDIAVVENDIDILKEMLKTPKYVENIVGVIIGKLQYKTKVQDALKVLEVAEELSSEQKNSLLTALEKRKGGEKLDQRVDEQIERIRTL